MRPGLRTFAPEMEATPEIFVVGGRAYRDIHTACKEWLDRRGLTTQGEFQARQRLAAKSQAEKREDEQ